MPQAAAAALISAIGVEAGSIGAAIVTGLVDVAFSVAASELAKVIAGKPKNAAANQAGASLQYTAGENQPLSFPLGTTAVETWEFAPDMSHGVDGQTPNAYLTMCRAFSAIPGAQISRVIINGEYADLGPDDGSGYGQPLTGKYAGYGWVKWYDGSQTAADPMMLAKYSTYPDRPWSAAMTCTGFCVAYFTFRVNRTLLPSEPQVSLEVNGIPLYDPRLDSTVGGSGPHRWGDPSTYAGNRSVNPIVMAYNILRGIKVAGQIWGYGWSADRLPLDNWFAAMNACDATVTTSSGTEPAYRAGLEVKVNAQPLDILNQIKAAAAAEFAEVGGTAKVRVGGPGLPVYYFTDDDLVISKPEALQPFPGLQSTYNAVNATYPDPGALYQAKAAPVRTDLTYQAADGDRFLPADLQLPACPYPNQVQRLQSALLKDDRRFRRHTLTLPPDAAGLEPLDCVGWTSTENGYTTKSFELTQVADEILTALQTVSQRERDDSDFNFTTADEISTVAPSPNGPIYPGAQTLSSWAVAAAAIEDTGSTGRIAAIQASWADPGTDDVKEIRIQIRRQSDQVVVADVMVQQPPPPEPLIDSTGAYLYDSTGAQLLAGEPAVTSVAIAQGIVSGVTYEARGVIVPYTGRQVNWSNWLAIIAPDVTNTPSDNQVGTPKIIDYAVTNRGSATVSNPITYSAGSWVDIQSFTKSVDGGQETIVIANGILKVTNDDAFDSSATITIEYLLIVDGVNIAQQKWVTGNIFNHGTVYLPFSLSGIVQSSAPSCTAKMQINATSVETLWSIQWDGTISITELRK